MNLACKDVIAALTHSDYLDDEYEGIEPFTGPIEKARGLVRTVSVFDVVRLL